MRDLQNSDDKTESVHWDWTNAGYADTWHEPAYAVLARYIENGTKILEIGAGGSHALAALAGRKGCEAYGVEPDSEGIKATLRFCQMESSAVQMVQGSGFDLPFESNTFDVVYSQGLIEHFPEEQSNAFLVEHRRVCREGGMVIVSVPNLYNIPHTLHKAWMGKRYLCWPERSYTPTQLKNALQAVGLTVENVDGLLPLWVITNFKYGGAWVSLGLYKLGLLDLINNGPGPRWRSRVGYMTFAVGRK